MKFPTTPPLAASIGRPDGKRVIYFEASVSHGELVSRDLRGGPAIPLVRYSDWWTID